MRPTLLQFRSPKEKTPGYYDIKVTNDGFKLDYSQSPTFAQLNLTKSFHKKVKRKLSQSSISGNHFRGPTSFSIQSRFPDYRIMERKTPNMIGPGTYNVQKTVDLLKSKPCPVKFQHSFYGKEAGQAGYLLIGDQLMYDEGFAARKSSHQQRNSEIQVKSKIMKKNSKKIKVNAYVDNPHEDNVVKSRDASPSKGGQISNRSIKRDLSQGISQRQSNDWNMAYAIDLALSLQQKRNPDIREVTIKQIKAVCKSDLLKIHQRNYHKRVGKSSQQQRKLNAVMKEVEVVDHQEPLVDMTGGSQTSSRRQFKPLLYNNDTSLAQAYGQQSSHRLALQPAKGKNRIKGLGINLKDIVNNEQVSTQDQSMNASGPIYKMINTNYR